MSAVEPNEQLKRLRASIDNIDAALVHILAERFRVTQAVGELKAMNDLPPSDPAREQAQTERLRAMAAEAGLDPDLAIRIHRVIVAEATDNHRAIAARMKTT